MRKLGLIAAASLFALPAFSTANAADDNGRVYYKEGTRLEFADFDMKINLQVQSKFTYEDVDQGGRGDVGLDAGEDVTSFDLRRVRVNFTGNLLKKQFSYQVQNDFRSSEGGGQMKDAWLQWNSDEANLRFGQTKIPFSRQELVSSSNLQFIDRSIVNDVFAPSRQIGALLHGPLGDAGTYYLGAFNGESEGEGINRAGQDNRLLMVAAANMNIGDYGSRGVEGDHRAKNDEFGATVGVSTLYGQGTGDVLDNDTAGDFDRFDLNVDLGARCSGFSAQSEFYYSTIDLDDVDGDSGEADLFGFYVQAGYMLDKEWELAARYAYLLPDEDVSVVDDQNEFSAVVNYYLNGHALKLQTGVTFDQTNLNPDVVDGDFTDFRFETQLAGYF